MSTALCMAQVILQGGSSGKGDGPSVAAMLGPGRPILGSHQWYDD